jgi:membrane-bound ClpP family serine protease
MSWITWACLGVIVLGFMLFVYGANTYNAVVGWTGVFLGIAGILAFLIRYIYSQFTKK